MRSSYAPSFSKARSTRPLRRVLGSACAVVTLGALGLFAPAPQAHSTVVQRCTAGNGAVVYTDGACAALGARPAPMRTELIHRLASEARIDAGSAFDADGLSFAGVAPTAGAPVRRSPAAGCARTPTQLARDLRGSFALGDVNRLAESYHWTGMSTREGERTLDRLGRLIGQQAIASRYYAAQIASLDDDGWTDAARGGDAGILQVVFAGDGVQQAIEFDVHRYQGCYFVSF
jgi:hypothetical protein